MGGGGTANDRVAGARRFHRPGLASRIGRVAHADMTLLRPHVGETVYIDLRAQFAGMQDYGDFQAFRADIVRHALESGVQLRPEEI